MANAEASGGSELTLTDGPDGNDTNPFLKRDPKRTPIVTTLEAASDEFRVAFGTIRVKRVDIVADKDE